MTRPLEHCPIWHAYSASGYFEVRNNLWHVEHSPRAAGGFIVPNVLVNSELIYISEEQKARLTTWLIDQRHQGNEQPLITAQVVQHIKAMSPLAPHIRVERLLRFIGEQTEVEPLIWTELRPS